MTNLTIPDHVRNNEVNKLFQYEQRGNGKRKRFVPVIGERIGNYENDGLYSIFLKLARDVYNSSMVTLNYESRLDAVIKDFNAEFKKCAPRYIFSNNKVSQINNDLFESLYLSAEEKCRGKQVVDSFIFAYNAVIQEGSCDNDRFFRKNDVLKYLDAYLELCRFVFEDEKKNQAELRSHRIIEHILNVYYCEDEKCFGLYSPFVLFSVLRTLNCIAALPDDINSEFLSKDCAEQLNTRRHIVTTYAVRSFSRFTTFKGKSYVVEYSRRNDRIICKKADEVSSVDNTKPIRLFEKITSYIYNYFNRPEALDEKEFHISVYGFCSYKRENDNVGPAEVEDLIYEIFSWMEDKKASNDSILRNKAIKKLVIQYNLIKKDTIDDSGYMAKSNEENHQLFYLYKNNYAEYDFAELIIKENNYDAYNNKHLEEALEANDMIFLLDCPWLATEDFNSVSEGDLAQYSKWVKDASYYKDIDFSQQKQNFFNKNHLFASINDQFNRMSVNNMSQYGKVVRVMKDYLIKWIQSKIEEYKKQNIYKTVYIYNSSLRGMAYSDFADYPIIREEAYSNKRFGIMRFSTRDNCPIDADDEKKVFISLWSLIKYVDISFAYLGVKEFFNQKLYRFIKEGKDESEKKNIINRDIISILRNIVFVVDYSGKKEEDFDNVKIQISLSKPARIVLAQANDDEEYWSKIKEIVSFFKAIIIDIIFKNSIGFGDEYIRDAFEICLYNQARTVKDLFFLHMYSSKRQAGSLTFYTVEVDSNSLVREAFVVDRLVPNFDTFGDKRAYNKLFDYLDMPRYPEYAVNSILNQTNKFFGNNSDSHSNKIIRNMMDTCKDFDYMDSFLYQNLKDILK